jgi:hypothetical protein
MPALSDRSRRSAGGGLRNRAWRLALAAALVLALSPVGAAAAAEPIVAVIDQARLMKLPDRVATVIVGNPLIADVSVQPGGMLVITAKGYGTTNLVILDRAGNPLLDRLIQVRGPRDDAIVVFRGVERETYSCTPSCERRITPGDNPKFFDPAVAQVGAFSAAATK